jgi:putative transposase
VDKAGNTIDVLLRAHRNKPAARRFFEKSIGQNGAPQTVNMDKSGANLAGLQAINAARETLIRIRQVKCQVSEQPHRTGPSGHQTPNPAHARVQGFPLCAHHPGGHRGDAYDQERADVVSVVREVKQG